MPLEVTDEELMGAYLAGDARAFEALVHRHRGSLYNFALRFVGSREKAEDLVQDTFLKLAKHAGEYHRRSKLSTWLYTIARNLCIDELRRARHRRALSLDGPGAMAADGAEAAPLLDGVASEDPDPARGAEAARLQPVLVAALAALPDEQREVFVLREYAGVPFKEISRITGTPVPTVKSRMRYALEGLKRYLAERGITADAAAAPAAVPGTVGA